MLILGIIIAVAVPKFIALNNETAQARCAAERSAINSALIITYNTLNLRDPANANWLLLVHYEDLADTMFTGRRIPTCPDGGIYTIVNGEVECSIHGK